ncbi:hypothetical protein OROGR_025155 [Orobanche gracilis]
MPTMRVVLLSSAVWWVVDEEGSVVVKLHATAMGQTLQVLYVVMPPLLQSAQLKPDVVITPADSDNEIDASEKAAVSAMPNLIMEICANMLNALNEYVQTSCTTSGNIICRRFKLVYIEVERAKAEDFDAEEGELLKDEEVFDQGSFLPFFDELSSYLMPMWVRKDKSAEERRISNCIFDDIAEKCRDTALMYCCDTYIPFLLEACNDENCSDVRQSLEVVCLNHLLEVQFCLNVAHGKQVSA